MAELASGAVTTLLGVIRNEAERLGRVQGDVQFIKEEMESMNSFLAYLARTREEEHDEQVRTWMNQVRILANDCNKCLDVYLYRRNPEFHRPRTGFRRHLWWGRAFWWLREMMEQRRVADQLHDLKARARDVGERRLRYGVKVSPRQPSSLSPGSEVGAGLTAASSSSLVVAAAAEDSDQEEDDDEEEEADREGHRLVPPTSSTVDDYFNKTIDEWVQGLKTGEKESPPTSSNPPMPCIAFVLQDTEEDHARASAFARHALEAAQRHFSRSIFVDISAVHLEADYYSVPPLRPKDILYYILREVRDPTDHQSLQGPGVNVPWKKTKWGIFFAKKKLLRQIKQDIRPMMVDAKIDGIKDTVIEKIEGIKNIMVSSDDLLQDKEIRVEKEKDSVSEKEEMELEDKIEKSPLEELLQLLITSTASGPEQDQSRKKAMRILSALYDLIIKTTADKLKKRMESACSQQQHIPLSSGEYEGILMQVFPRTTPIAPVTSTSSSVGYEIKEMIDTVKHMVQQLQEYNKSDKNQEAVGPTQNLQEVVRKKMEDIKRKITEQLTINLVLDEILHNLQSERILIILKTDLKYVSKWEETRRILSMLKTSRCFAGAAIMTTTNRKSTRQFKEFFSDPQPKVIEYSVVGRYLDDIVSQLTRKKMNEGKLNIVHNILEECEPYESSMEIFAHALKANPQRSTEELRKLHNMLQARPTSGANIARKIIKFSYSDLHKQHKSCFLYLAIFPPASAQTPEYRIKRSTLIARWVAEGLITTDDWCWSSSVDEAERCFKSLIDRKLVRPVDYGDTGRVKTCTVEPVVHRFITKIAKKQHIIEPRLSFHLARHFSIFNDIRLRMTDKIQNFLTKNIHDLPQISKLKVLDLEGCDCFDRFAKPESKRFLKDICSKILTLRYLSLRRTDVNELPRDINNLHELEVLDIRQTNIPASATRNVLLLKLKRLLAGHCVDPCPSSTDTGKHDVPSSVEIPELIEKMLDMEVLSSVKPRKHRDLTDIGCLYQLKKLGVVINDGSHLQSLLTGISNLHHCLRSLSITLHIDRCHGITNPLTLQKIPEYLESLSIRGSTQKGQLLKLLVTEESKNLTKLTLRCISLEQDDLKVDILAKLGKKFGKLSCVRLQHVSYVDTQLTFNKGDFPMLNLVHVDSSNNCIKISFPSQTSELEKIVIDKYGVHRVPC